MEMPISKYCTFLSSINYRSLRPLQATNILVCSDSSLLRADFDLASSSDFLSNLLVLLLRILNSGLSDSGLLVHLSEATAGSLNGVGHSTIYEELGTYSSVFTSSTFCGTGRKGLTSTCHSLLHTPRPTSLLPPNHRWFYRCSFRERRLRTYVSD